MPLSLKEIYYETKTQHHLSLLAGEKGLQNIMTWVYVSEDYSTHDFLKGGELIITTGINCQTEISLYNFIETMIKSNTCGLILNLGKYIHRKNVSERILAMCERHNYPLFSMPWEIHIYNITRDYYNRIFMDAQRDTSITDAFLAFIRNDSDAQKYALETLQSSIFSDSIAYCVSILSFETSLSEDFRHILMMQIEKCLKCNNTALHIIFYKNSFLFITTVDDIISIKKQMTEILTLINEFYSTLNFHIGIGSSVHTLSDLSVSYRRALAAVSAGKSNNRTIFSFDEMGFFRILYSVENHELLEQVMSEQLKIIENYDTQHKTAYLETLRLYLLCNGSIQQIADKMYCHRNTINYRIRTIKENWNLNLEDVETRFNLLVAFYIRDYFNSLR